MDKCPECGEAVQVEIEPRELWCGKCQKAFDVDETDMMKANLGVVFGCLGTQSRTHVADKLEGHLTLWIKKEATDTDLEIYLRALVDLLRAV